VQKQPLLPRANPEDLHISYELIEKQFQDQPDANQNFEGRRFIFETDQNHLSIPSGGNSNTT
jgi:hypothetical protein